jgi:hypothetical protein
LKSLNDHAGYVAARDRYEDLYAQVDKINEDLAAAQEELGADDPIAAEADAILRGEKFDHEAAHKVEVKIAALRRRLAVVELARDQAYLLMDAARREACEAVVDSALPIHRKHVADVIDAAVKLALALKAEEDLRTTLADAGIPFSHRLRAMPIHSEDFKTNDPSCMLASHVREAVGADLIRADDPILKPLAWKE